MNSYIPRALWSIRSEHAEPDSRFVDPADGLLVQIPATGVIWWISHEEGPSSDRDRNGLGGGMPPPGYTAWCRLSTGR
jgi:hypothetical protein